MGIYLDQSTVYKRGSVPNRRSRGRRMITWCDNNDNCLSMSMTQARTAARDRVRGAMLSFMLYKSLVMRKPDIYFI